MAQTTPFRIGADASCTDGACGQVSRIIINPVAREVTHLVIDPRHWHGPGRLVPIDLVDAETGQIRLRCTLAEFQTLRSAQETESVPDLDPTAHHYFPPDKGNRLLLSSGPTEAPRKLTVDAVVPSQITRPCLTDSGPLLPRSQLIRPAWQVFLSQPGVLSHATRQASHRGRPDRRRQTRFNETAM
jgi:hypothetical protein